MRNWRIYLLTGGGVLASLLIAVAFLEPSRIVPGFLCGDDFYKGRPTRYWREVLRADGEKNFITKDTVAEFEFSKQAIPVLCACARDEDVNVRGPAISMLGRQHSNFADEIVPTFRAALKDSDLSVRINAARNRLATWGSRRRPHCRT